MEELDESIRAAFAQVEVAVAPPGDLFEAPDSGADLIVDPEGAALGLWVKHAAVVNDQQATRLVHEHENLIAMAAGARTVAILFVVADQVTRTARRVLTQAGAGYLDRRGHLGLHAPGLIVEVDIEPQIRQVGRRDPLSGNVGLEVAAALLTAPERRPAVRQLSRELGRSVSTVSEVLAGLREDRYIDERNTVSGTRLFWELAERWPGDGDYLVEAPRPGRDSSMELLKFEFNRVGEVPGWALRGPAAASVLGAPVAVRADQPLDFFVPNATIAHRARRLLGAATSVDVAGCSVAVAPVPAACMARFDPPENYFEFPTTHPLFVALDLAQDAGRGREVLSDWTPSGPWARVW
ncbi:transcriptional regulator [Kribbella sp. NPDC002412]